MAADGVEENAASCVIVLDDDDTDDEVCVLDDGEKKRDGGEGGSSAAGFPTRRKKRRKRMKSNTSPRVGCGFLDPVILDDDDDELEQGAAAAGEIVVIDLTTDEGIQDAVDNLNQLINDELSGEIDTADAEERRRQEAKDLSLARQLDAEESQRLGDVQQQEAQDLALALKLQKEFGSDHGKGMPRSKKRQQNGGSSAGDASSSLCSHCGVHEAAEGHATCCRACAVGSGCTCSGDGGGADQPVRARYHASVHRSAGPEAMRKAPPSKKRKRAPAVPRAAASLYHGLPGGAGPSRGNTLPCGCQSQDLDHTCDTLCTDMFGCDGSCDGMKGNDDADGAEEEDPITKDPSLMSRAQLLFELDENQVTFNNEESTEELVKRVQKMREERGAAGHIPALRDIVAVARRGLQRVLTERAKALKILKIENNPASFPGQPLYEAFYSAWQKHHDVSIKLVFHGTPTQNVEAILKDGLDPKRRGVNGQAYGRGEYFAKDATTSISYCAGGNQMIVFAVLVPTSSKAGASSSARGAKRGRARAHPGATDGITMENETMIVVNKSCQQLPLASVTFDTGLAGGYASSMAAAAMGVIGAPFSAMGAMASHVMGRVRAAPPPPPPQVSRAAMSQIKQLRKKLHETTRRGKF